MCTTVTAKSLEPGAGSSRAVQDPCKTLAQ